MKGKKKNKKFQSTLETFNCHVRSAIKSYNQLAQPKQQTIHVNVF